MAFWAANGQTIINGIQELINSLLVLTENQKKAPRSAMMSFLDALRKRKSLELGLTFHIQNAV